MNAGQESEFFRENQRPLEISSDGKPVYDVPLFNTQPRKKYSYSTDGRRVVDGELIAPDPDQLWQETLKRMACFTSCEVKLDDLNINIQKGRRSRLVKASESLRRVFSFGGGKKPCKESDKVIEGHIHTTHPSEGVKSCPASMLNAVKEEPEVAEEEEISDKENVKEAKMS